MPPARTPLLHSRTRTRHHPAGAAVAEEKPAHVPLPRQRGQPPACSQSAVHPCNNKISRTHLALHFAPHRSLVPPHPLSAPNPALQTLNCVSLCRRGGAQPGPPRSKAAWVGGLALQAGSTKRRAAAAPAGPTVGHACRPFHRIRYRFGLHSHCALQARQAGRPPTAAAPGPFPRHHAAHPIIGVPDSVQFPVAGLQAPDCGPEAFVRPRKPAPAPHRAAAAPEAAPDVLEAPSPHPGGLQHPSRRARRRPSLLPCACAAMPLPSAPDIGAFTSPGNRYGSLNQDHVVRGRQGPRRAPTAASRRRANRYFGGAAALLLLRPTPPIYTLPHRSCGARPRQKAPPRRSHRRRS